MANIVKIQNTRKDNRTLVAKIKDAFSAFRSPKAFFSQRQNYLRNLWIFNGEKNLGELGPERDYYVDYQSFRARGKQFFLDNEVAQMIINSMVDWVIGNGLKLECEPNEMVLKAEGIDLDVQKFSDTVEAYYSVRKELKESTLSRMRNLSEEERRAFTNANNGGGILVVLRVRNNIVNYEIIDGSHVRHYSGGSDLNPTLIPGGRIQNGIEMSDSGEHLGFWVQDNNYNYYRIAAKSPSTGLTMAFMYGGNDYTIDNSRTLPVLAGLFQTLQQMDDYKTATLGSAKSQNAIAYQVTTEVGGDNQDVLSNITALAQNWDPNGPVPHDNYGQAMADKVAAETGKLAFAPGEGQKISPVEKNEMELYFKDFWNTLFECVCAAAGMPPNVVLKRFDTSFSSARAAIKDWAHSLLLKRYKHGMGFLQPGYELQLHLDILTGKVEAPGYLKAFREDNQIVLGAYRMTRWIGDNVPEIDEKKEVDAQRALLGSAFDHIPLTSPRRAAETLGLGSFKNNAREAGIDMKDAESNGLKPEPVAVPVPGK